jgi:hypothetical protein
LKNNYRNVLLVTTVFGVLILLGALFVQLSLGGALGRTPEEIPPWTATFPPEVIATNEAQTWAVETAEVEQIARITPEPKKPDVHIPAPLSPTADPLSNGVITDSPEPMIGDYGYEWQNFWMSVIDSSHIRVTAGAMVDNQSPPDSKLAPLGVLRVRTDLSELNNEYQMPDREGALRIVGAHHTCLDLIVVETKRSLQFDVVTRQWFCGSK